MQLSATTDYAVRILLFLGSNPEIQSAEDIAKATSIPPNYIFAIIRKLRGAGLAQSHQGSRGGYSIAMPPQNISMYDVMVATEGTLKINRCLMDDQPCTQENDAFCAVNSFYKRLQNLFETELKSKILADLL